MPNPDLALSATILKTNPNPHPAFITLTYLTLTLIEFVSISNPDPDPTLTYINHWNTVQSSSMQLRHLHLCSSTTISTNPNPERISPHRTSVALPLGISLPVGLYSHRVNFEPNPNHGSGVLQRLGQAGQQAPAYFDANCIAAIDKVTRARGRDKSWHRVRL